jgi:2-polyprenyl-3-methyl-5-hydroxy-6-metoxy-1,4-benzoquinol methylase
MQRQRDPELMDDPTLDERAHLAALRGLERLNAASGSVIHMWNEIRAFLADGMSISLLDVASGSGDIPIALSKLAAIKGLKLQVSGSDISQRAVESCAQRAQRSGVDAHFFVLNALDGQISAKFDVVTTSLFTHHLDPPDVVRLLRAMSQAARKLVIVNDLERSWWNLVQVTIATRLLSASPVVHYDGPTSVRAAYTVDEFQDMARRAGLSGCLVERRFPCRLMLIWSPP